MAGSWRFILDKPGDLDAPTVIIGGFRTAAGCGKGGGLLLAERGEGWRLTVEWVSDQRLNREVGSAQSVVVLGNRRLDALRSLDTAEMSCPPCRINTAGEPVAVTIVQH